MSTLLMHNERSNGWLTCMALGAVGLAVAAAPASGAELVAYYTLDNTTSGLVNNGTNGLDSDLSLYTGMTEATPTPGIIGSALSFGGNSAYVATAPDNAADALLGYPFTMSFWISNADTGGVANSVIAISDSESFDHYYSLGVEKEAGITQLLRRGTDPGANQNRTRSNTTPGDLTGSDWRHVIGVFAFNSVQFFIDGKSSPVQLEVFSINFQHMDSITVGGLYRETVAGGAHEIIQELTANVDDTGLFSGTLDAVDAALINGLGRTSGLGLDWLAAARALADSTEGTIMDIGGQQWQRVSGLSGDTGDWGGSAVGGDAFIVTGSSGEGIQVVPEPGAIGALAGMALLCLRRSRTR